MAITDWKRGRGLVFIFPDEQYRVNQWVLSVKELEKRDSLLASRIRIVLAAQTSAESAHSVQDVIREIQSHPDLSKIAAGETMLFGITTSEGAFATAPVSSRGNAHERSVGLDRQIGLGIQIDDLLAAFDSTLSKLPALEEVRLSLIHTHAGIGAPLNNGDESAIKKILQAFRKRHPALRFVSEIIAAPEEDRGEVVFILQVL